MTLCRCGCGQEVKEGNKFIHGHNAPNKNRHFSEEHKKKMSIVKKNKMMGDLNPAKRPEVRKKISKNRKGKGLSQIVWNKGLTSKTDNRILSGERNGWYGKHPSEEIRKIMSEKKKGQKYHLGYKHSEETKKRISIVNRGNNASNWIDGRSYLLYCYKFNGRLKNEVRKRDEYQCQNPNCLCTQLESIVKYGKVLHVHHIHYDKQNCYPDLITLCPKCNLKSNFNRNYWEQLFMEILKKRNLLNWKLNKN